jgi:hypothetical protein
MEHRKNIPDFTTSFIKIFTLARDLRKLRCAFPHSGFDERAERDRKFIEEWRKIRDSSRQR